MKALGAAVLLAAAAGTAAAKSETRIVFARGDWEVRAVRWDDGGTACLAEVRGAADAFTIFADRRHPVRLQFYSSQWVFGARQRYADLQIKVDTGAPMPIARADLYRQSALFELPAGPAGHRILSQIEHGHTLYLRDGQGRRVKSYSLVGSGAAMKALAGCVRGLR